MNNYKNKFQSLFYLLSLLDKRIKFRLLYSFFSIVFLAIYQIISVYLMSPLISYITLSNDNISNGFISLNFSPFHSLLLFLFASISSFILNFLILWKLKNVVVDAGSSLAIKSFESLCSKNYLYFRSNNPSELASAIIIQLNQLIGSFFNPLILAGSSIIISIFLILFLLFNSPYVLISIFLALLIISPLFYINQKLSPKSKSYEVKQLNTDIVSILTSLLSSPHAIFFTDITKYLIKNFKKVYISLRTKMADIEFSRSFTKYIIEFFLSLSLLIIFTLNISNNFNLDLEKIAISLIILQKLIPNVQQILTTFLLVRSSTAAFNTILEINSEKYLYRKSYKRSQQTLELKNISSKLIKKTKSRNINIKLNSGDRVLLKGASGSGKSTLLDIISGLKEPDSGEILVNNKKTCIGFNLSSFVPQRSFALPGDLAFNITLIEDKLSKTNIEKLNHVFNLSLLSNDFHFNDLFNKKISEDLSNISGGQLQRIAIARALFKSPYFLFLDEATSALPEMQSKLIMNNISEYLPKSIIIYISHKNYESEIANKIIYL